MPELDGLISDDSRRPIERLRRVQLWRIADAYEVSYPAGAPKTAMIPILEGAGIDVTKPLPTGDQMLAAVPVQDEDGNTHIEHMPIIKEHATANKDIDYDAVIQAKAEKSEAKEELQGAMDEIAELKRKLAELSTQNGAESTQNVNESSQYEDMKMGELRAECKKRGINSFGMSKQAIIEKLKS